MIGDRSKVCLLVVMGGVNVIVETFWTVLITVQMDRKVQYNDVSRKQL